VGDDAEWLFLKVIWGQPVIIRPDELLEVEPDAPGQAPQLTRLLFSR
jgi:hypothetical protein